MPMGIPEHPEQFHRNLISTFHGALGDHRLDAGRKASYAKMLASLMGDQAKSMSGRATVQGQMGTQTESTNPTGLPEGQMIQPTTTWAGNPLPRPVETFPQGWDPLAGQAQVAQQPLVALLRRLIAGGGAQPVQNPILAALAHRAPLQPRSILNTLRGY